MRQDNLLCLRRKPLVPATTDARHDWEIVPNLVRGLRLTGLDQLWVADITYIRLQEEFVYLAVIIDAFSRRVVGWAMADHLQASRRSTPSPWPWRSADRPGGSLIHHSDRGVQYACSDYTKVLGAHGMAASMSRVGNPYDNAKAGELHEDAQGRGGRRQACTSISRRPSIASAPSSTRSTTSSACTRPWVIVRRSSSRHPIDALCSRAGTALREPRRASRRPRPVAVLTRACRAPINDQPAVRGFSVSPEGCTPRPSEKEQTAFIAVTLKARAPSSRRGGRRLRDRMNDERAAISRKAYHEPQ